MKKYFLYYGSKQFGPLDIEELKSYNLTKDTPIWFEELKEWTTIGKVEELKGMLIPTPPPFKTEVIPTPLVEKQETKKNTVGYSRIGSFFLGRWLFLLIVLIALGLIGYFIYRKFQDWKYQNISQNPITTVTDPRTEIRNNLNSYIKVETNQYNYNEFGGISNLVITVANNTDYLIDNVMVNVIYLQGNCEVLDTKVIEFNYLGPQSKNPINVPNTIIGTCIKYEIVSIKSKALGLN